MERIVPPTNTEAARGQQQAAAENLVKAISENDLKKYQDTAKELLDDHDSVSLVSAALSLLTKERKNTPVRISGVQPISEQAYSRSEEHTSELQSRGQLVFRLLLAKKKKYTHLNRI